MLNDDEVNTFTQTHDRKDRPDWDKLFSSIGFDSTKDFDSLDGIAFARGPGSYTALRITASFFAAVLFTGANAKPFQYKEVITQLLQSPSPRSMAWIELRLEK